MTTQMWTFPLKSMISSLTNDRGDSSGPTRTKMNKPASAFWAVSATGMLQQLGASREGSELVTQSPGR
jgi:hypothetical protein